MASKAATELAITSLRIALPIIEKYIEERIEINVHTMEQTGEYAAQAVVEISQAIDDAVADTANACLVGGNIIKALAGSGFLEKRYSMSTDSVKDMARVYLEIAAGWTKEQDDGK